MWRQCRPSHRFQRRHASEANLLRRNANSARVSLHIGSVADIGHSVQSLHGTPTSGRAQMSRSIRSALPWRHYCFGGAGQGAGAGCCAGAAGHRGRGGSASLGRRLLGDGLLGGPPFPRLFHRLRRRRGWRQLDEHRVGPQLRRQASLTSRREVIRFWLIAVQRECHGERRFDRQRERARRTAGLTVRYLGFGARRFATQSERCPFAAPASSRRRLTIPALMNTLQAQARRRRSQDHSVHQFSTRSTRATEAAHPLMRIRGRS